MRVVMFRPSRCRPKHLFLSRSMLPHRTRNTLTKPLHFPFLSTPSPRNNPLPLLPHCAVLKTTTCLFLR
jgi:hypothetical protein